MAWFIFSDPDISQLGSSAPAHCNGPPKGPFSSFGFRSLILGIFVAAIWRDAVSR